MKKFKFNDIEFRLASVDEVDRFIVILQTRDPEAEEYIFNELTEKKYDIASLDAGLVLLIITLAIKKSGYAKNGEELANKVDEKVAEITNNILYTIFYSTILKAQPSTKLPELKKMSLSELLEYFVLSEIILTGHAGSILNTKKMREAMKESKSKPSTGAAYINSTDLDQLNKFLERDEFERQMG